MVDLPGIWQLLGLDQIAVSSWIILGAVVATLCGATLSSVGATVGVSVEDLVYRIRNRHVDPWRPSG